MKLLPGLHNEEAGEHWTPRDAVKLMAKLVFLPVAREIESGMYLLYDGACGTGGMLTVAEETLQDLAEGMTNRPCPSQAIVAALARQLDGYEVIVGSPESRL